MSKVLVFETPLLYDYTLEVSRTRTVISRTLNRRKKSIGLVGLGLVLRLAVSLRNSDGFFPVINGMCNFRFSRTDTRTPNTGKWSMGSGENTVMCLCISNN